MRIKAVRRAKELSQGTLARKIGTHQAYIAQLEGSVENPQILRPSVPTLQKIAKACKVKAGTLLE